VAFKKLGELLFQLPGLVREAIDHDNEGTDHLPVGLGDHRRGLELRSV
jgi:hypothetical protein